MLRWCVTAFPEMYFRLAFYILTLVAVDKVEVKQLMVIDADPGLDDLIAMFVALGDPEVEVIAITLVRGNTEMQYVINNTLQGLKAAGKLSIPVYVGARYGLIESPPSDNYFGINGLGDVPLPELNINKKLETQPAAVYLANIVKKFPGEVTIMAIGPLTNIALALHLNPWFLKLAKQVNVLTGSIRGVGNVRPGVEFNSYADAAAGSFVFNWALDSATILNVFSWETVIDSDLEIDWRWNVLAKIDNSVVDLMNKIERIQQERRPEVKYMPPDVYPMCLALCPEYVVEALDVYISVEYRGHKTQGMLLVDYGNVTKRPANARIITKINTAVLKGKMYDSLSAF